MITWMQRHKKWLIITIWISTIAFVGAGFVGWGQYSYGDKAGAVAKVGDIEISRGELQTQYSNLYARYNQVFQGNFDEEQAKQFGLQKQALKELIQQALILNLAKEYSLAISDKELYQAIKSQKVFYNQNGTFDKNIYKQILSQNRLSIKEYEDNLRKELLISKTFSLLPIKTSKNENDILNTILNISDKIEYKILRLENMKISLDDNEIEKFWKTISNEFKTEIIYEVEYIEQKFISNNYDEVKIEKYYNENKTHFKSDDGKIKSLEDAKDDVIKELNQKVTKDKALRTYIAYKKDKLDESVEKKTANISQINNKFNNDVLEKVKNLSLTSPYAKPIKVDNNYYTFKLIKIIPSKIKSFKDAKKDVLPIYLQKSKKEKILKLAKSNFNNFKGEKTDFITINDADKLKDMKNDEASQFLQKLFVSEKKNSFIPLDNGDIILYKILEQKLLTKENEVGDTITKLKGNIFNEGLIKNLQNRYPSEIFIQGI